MQLKNLCLEMQIFKQDRIVRPEVREEEWCLKSKSQGHDKDHYPAFTNYLSVGGLMPLRPESQARPSTTLALWCAIYQVTGKHTTYNFHLLQKYTQTPQKWFCKFCWSEGHDKHACRSYELIMDKTPTYRVQAETRSLDQNAGLTQTGFQGRGRG